MLLKVRGGKSQLEEKERNGGIGTRLRNHGEKTCRGGGTVVNMMKKKLGKRLK